MIRILFFVLIAGIINSCDAQPVKISGKITYVATVRNSLYIPGAGDNTDTTWLYFNDTASSYLVDTRITADSKKIAAQLEKLNLSAEDKKEAIASVSSSMEKYRIQFDYHRNGSSTLSGLWTIGQRDYCRVDTIVDFNWELLPDTMRILGFLCQKATSKSVWAGAAFRKFTVWYTPEIPVAYGPKNIFGLPGLILMADSQYYNYTAVKIKTPLSAGEVVQLSPCKGLTLIGKKEAEEENRKTRENIMNMQKLRSNP